MRFAQKHIHKKSQFLVVLVSRVALECFAKIINDQKLLTNLKNGPS